MTKRILVGAVLASVVLAWPLWTWLVPTLLASPPLSDCLFPFMAGDGHSVGYHFIVLRKLLMSAVLVALGFSLWRLIARTRATESCHSIAGPLCSVLIAGQCFGATLMTLFPEALLTNLFVYGRFAENRTLPGFSIKKFFTIREGLTTRDEVVALLGRGRPGTIVPEARDLMWWYSGDWSTTGWWFRVHFDDRGIVTKLDSFLWWD